MNKFFLVLKEMKVVLIFLFGLIVYSLLNLLVIFKLFESDIAVRFNIIIGITLQIIGLTIQNYVLNKNVRGYGVSNPLLPFKRAWRTLFPKSINLSAKSEDLAHYGAGASIDLKIGIDPESKTLEEQIEMLRLEIADVRKTFTKSVKDLHENDKNLSNQIKLTLDNLRQNVKKFDEEISDLRTGNYFFEKVAYFITYVGTIMLLSFTIVELLI